MSLLHLVDLITINNTHNVCKINGAYFFYRSKLVNVLKYTLIFRVIEYLRVTDAYEMFRLFYSTLLFRSMEHKVIFNGSKTKF